MIFLNPIIGGLDVFLDELDLGLNYVFMASYDLSVYMS